MLGFARILIDWLIMGRFVFVATSSLSISTARSTGRASVALVGRRPTVHLGRSAASWAANGTTALFVHPPSVYASTMGETVPRAVSRRRARTLSMANYGNDVVRMPSSRDVRSNGNDVGAMENESVGSGNNVETNAKANPTEEAKDVPSSLARLAPSPERFASSLNMSPRRVDKVYQRGRHRRHPFTNASSRWKKTVATKARRRGVREK